MKNLKISDLAPLFEKLETVNAENNRAEEAVKKQLFKAYESLEEIKALISSGENLEHGEYNFNNHCEFCYQIELSDSIKSLPYIEDFLTRSPEYGPFWVDLKNNLLEVNLISPITVNWNHNNRCYFVYDRDAGKCIINSFKEDCKEDETMARLMIEKYQRDSGEFGDVIEVCDRYGQYLGHVLSEYGKLSDEEFKKVYDDHYKTVFKDDEE